MPQSPRDEASPTQPIQALPAAASALKSPIMTRSLSGTDPLSMSDSESGLPFRRSNPSAASLYASTLSPPGSRSMSPAGRGSPSRVLAGTAFESASNRPLPEGAGEKPGDPLNLILRAFVPHIAIQASADVEEIAASKGFRRGFWELLRPFGERIQGKVAIRDSNGVSKLAEDFSVRFTKFGANVENPDPPGSSFKQQGQNGVQESTSKDRRALADVEAVVDRHLSYAEDSFLNGPQHSSPITHGLDIESTSPYYALFLRRLLSGMPIVPQETFAHPVACVVAVSARSDDSVAELRQIYNETSQGPNKLPAWVDGDYLRYYVLVHDEEKDDITKSMALFEQMKRHLGLHCHLLRLRSSQSAETDDDSIPLPRSDWMSAGEELAEIRRSEDEEDFEDPTRYIFESDVTAIRTFVREMVTQSIVPTMERHVSIWNDQVASRRRGLAGRFMNLSRKFNFGGGSRSSTGSSLGKDNYLDSGFFRADAPEAIMRKLADYAFMLRDWKLAHSTYDLLRPDFADFKAWKYHAAVNEMAAVSLLIQPQQISSKSRVETIDQMLESAFYSYNTRCSAPYAAIRSLTLALELLRLRGGTNIDDASRWGIRLLESRILGRVGDALIKERIAISYASKEGVGSWHWGKRHRKSAAWSILAADAWVQQAKYLPAQKCLNEAQKIYAALPSKRGISQFKHASQFVDSLEHRLSERLDMAEEAEGGQADDGAEESTDEESEAFTETRPRRMSAAKPPSVIETAPLHVDKAESEPSKGFDKAEG
ncbi:hypothetical protein ACO1O0_004620 [Amphichorda felina]